MRACWLKWVGRDWSISADYIWLNYSGANTASLRSLRAALENASRFLSSALLRVRIPPLAHKKALQVHKGLERCVLKGWDGGIRTPNSRHQKPEFYR